ncbi:hypothetical protein A2U01_0023490, partial [Trifolium medium]|nr:hypothetical protein [Trifolium medium]
MLRGDMARIKIVTKKLTLIDSSMTISVLGSVDEGSDSDWSKNGQCCWEWGDRKGKRDSCRILGVVLAVCDGTIGERELSDQLVCRLEIEKSVSPRSREVGVGDEILVGSEQKSQGHVEGGRPMPSVLRTREKDILLVGPTSDVWAESRKKGV